MEVINIMGQLDLIPYYENQIKKKKKEEEQNKQEKKSASSETKKDDSGQKAEGEG